MEKTLDSFEDAWKQGQRPAMEDWLLKFEGQDRRQQLWELMCIELWWRTQAGDTPNPQEYEERFPDESTEVDQAFAQFRSTATTFGGQRQPLEPVDATKPVWSDPPPDESAPSVPGDSIRYFGEYELLEEIARGGMGVVFRARQVKLNRIVALKMILSGELAGPVEVQRFQTEAKAAAKLDHPGIVPIFEIGEHEGRHFFSMGYVPGESLTECIEDSPLTPRDAAEITKKIAEAVAYAHENGVIHRDLKPSNVLLDSSGEPRVTDFGLAKQLEVESELTHTGMVLGTPSYMAPEQAAGKTAEVGPLSDVYSIGALLFCLVSGKPPFRSNSVHDTIQQVIHEMPPRLSTSGISIPRDLETICLQCLEKQPRHRYQSASLLAADLERFLQHYPISARRTGPAGRLWQWTQRNRVVAGLLVTVFVLLLSGVLVTIGNRTDRIESAAIRMQTAEVRLDDEIQQVEEQFAAGDTFLADYPQLTTSANASLARALQEFELALSEFDHSLPKERMSADRLHSAAVAQFHAGQANRYLDNRDTAERSFRSAITRLQALTQSFPDESRHRFQQSIVLDYLGELLRSVDETAEAEAAYQQALLIQQSLTDDEKDNKQYRRELARSHNNYAIFLEATQRKDEARQHYLDSKKILTELLMTSPDEVDWRVDFARTLINIGHLYEKQNLSSEAIPVYREAHDSLITLTETLPEIPRYRFLRAICENNLGYVLSMQDTVEAEMLLVHAADEFDQLPSLPMYRLGKAMCLNNLGVLYGSRGEWTQAEEKLEPAGQIVAQLVEEYPNRARYASELGRIYGGLGAIAQETGRRQQAIENIQTAIEHQSMAWSKNPSRYWRLLTNHHLYLASLLATGDGLGETELYAAAHQIQLAVAAAAAQSFPVETSPFQQLTGPSFERLLERSDVRQTLRMLGDRSPATEQTKPDH